MPDENLRRLIMFCQVLRGIDEVADIGGKTGFGKIPLALAKACKIEAQYGNAVCGQ
jgi:hypothetical protein